MARSTTKQSGTQAPVRATSEKSEPVSCRIDRASGRDQGDAGHATRASELQQHLGQSDEK